MRVLRNPELAWWEVGGETIVIHLGRKMMYGLNPAGGRLWAALEGGAAVEELEGSVPAEVGTEGPTRAAVRAFLAELAGEDLILIDPPLRENTGAPEDEGTTAHLPRITWQEEVRRFAGKCTLNPAGSVICSQVPLNS